MSNSLRLGIIGIGYGAKVQLPGFQMVPGVEVVAVADSGSGRARQVAAAMGVARAFSDWRGLVDMQDLDAISVATPPSFHAEVVCAALEAGKHVLCEKPFGKDLNQAMHMFELAQKSQVVHAVDFEFRMERGIRELKRQVDAGTIGQIRRIDVTWLTGGRSDPYLPWSWQHDAQLGGGVLDGFGSHVMDYVEWIIQSPIIAVFARCQTLVNYRKDVDGCQRQVSAEDECDLVCDLANGATANLRFSNCYPFGLGHRCDIYGDLGRLVYCHQAPFAPNGSRVYMETASTGLRPVELEPMPVMGDLDSRVLPFSKLASAFVEATRGCLSRDLPDFSDGLRVRRVLGAARNSLKSHSRAVVSDASGKI